MQLQLAGQSAGAEELYAAILREDPGHHPANYCLGMLRIQARRPCDALPFLLAALESKPEQRDYWLGLLEALLLAGRLDEASSYLALARQHGLAGAQVEAYANRLQGALSAAMASVEQDERTLLSLMQRRRYDEAKALALRLTERFPKRGPGWKVLGALTPTEHGYEAALAALETAARLMPRDVEAHLNLGNVLAKANQCAKAERHLRMALKLAPNLPAAHCRLALVYENQGRFADAEASLRRSIEMGANAVVGDDEVSRSHLLFLMSHNPSIGPDELFAAHCRYGEYFEGPLRDSWPQHANDRNPDRRLKVGFVSGDLCNHAVATFIEPLLARLGTSGELELHAYYTNERRDGVSERLLRNFRSWNVVCGINDAELAGVIMKDGIDILIDLSGHTALNRLPAFARKPAPIQITWMGYPGTTGLRAMDYFFADPHFLPPGEFDRYFTEKLIHLPTAPFQPQQSAPPLNPLPALSNGYVTFGSFNRLGKINHACVKMWSQLLGAVPNSRMILAGLEPHVSRRTLVRQFADCGIAKSRLTFHDRCGVLSYLALYHQVDLCLDTMPYNGGTTTIHGLWMGVPTLTVAGPTPAGRQGAAILGQMKLHEFIAGSAADFTVRGRRWAGQLGELADLRAQLRERWQTSADRKPEFIARAMTGALRRAWRRWCANLPAEPFCAAAGESG
jgi:predicted O-linked N-acetylglucosamine transferase (SPINDLY family)